MKYKFLFAFGVCSLLLSVIFWERTNSRVENIMTEQDWKMKIVTIIPSQFEVNAFGHVNQISIDAELSFSADGTYQRLTRMQLQSHLSSEQSDLLITDSGIWKVKAGYLLMAPIDFQSGRASNHETAPAHIEVIKEFYRMETQQSRKIEVVNEKTLLLSGIGLSSIALTATNG